MSRLRARGRLLLVVGVLVSPNPAKSEEIGSFAALLWDYRVLVGSTPDPERVLAVFTSAEAELDDRDLLYFLVSDDARFTNAHEAQSEEFWKEAERLVPQSGFVIIGRDGGVKARYESLDLDAVFAVIDTMPMRIQEMRSRGVE